MVNDWKEVCNNRIDHKKHACLEKYRKDLKNGRYKPVKMTIRQLIKQKKFYTNILN